MGERILVVDDNDDNRFTLVERLRRDGFRDVVAADGGRAALDVLAAEPIDLVLLDIMMPDVDGLRVLEIMRADARLREVPVIMVSAVDDPGIAARCIELGADDRLPKPFDPAMFRARVRAGIERRRLRELERQYFRSHDPGTGLPNQERLRDAVVGAIDSGRPFLVAGIALGGLDELRHSRGAAAIDAVVRRTAASIGSHLDPADMLARVATDELGLVLLQAPGAVEPLARLQAAIEAMAQPMRIDGTEVAPLPHAGAVIRDLQTAADGPSEPDALIAGALAAMSRAVETEAPIEIGNVALRDAALQRLALQSDLVRAIGAGELALHYQPLVHLGTGAVHGVEALVRWQHPERGAISLGAFIPVAERSGVIVGLGRWVIEEACRQARAWQDAFGPADSPTVAINVSPRQVHDPGFLDHLGRAIADTGADPSKLKIEVTEGCAVRDPALTRRLLDAIGALGIARALDDFGTGFSSLSYLQQLPFDTLKIDQAFVHGIGDHDRNRAIVRCIVDLAHALGMDVVAEGVETAADQAALRALGVDIGQGYLFSRPLDAAAASAAIRAMRLSATTAA
ncbi:MAG: EAL domain-containing protein [Alphaproteobacteria bacterium]|nr:EAL domain-containing protein [Alphaproteobacteria bacterium]